MPDNIARAIEACYDAAFEFERWPKALQQLADSLGVTSCVIRTSDEKHPFRHNQRHLTKRLPDSTEHHEFSALWIKKIEGAPCPHADRIKQLVNPSKRFIVEDELTTPEERNLLPYYQEIARPGNREWWATLGFKVMNRNWCLPMFRDARRGAFDIREESHFLRVAPDLKRIISIAEKVWDTAVGRSLITLDRLNCAGSLLDCHGYVTRSNGHAEALFGSDLVIHHRRVHATDRASDARLQALIGSAISNRSGELARVEPVMIARNGSPWLLAEVIPMTSFAHDLFNGGDVLLYFTNLVVEGSASEQLLRCTFQLTAAEARLASGLAGGEGVDVASARLAISRETARTQLRAIFAKTGTHRQAELTALLSRLRRPTQQ
jgi:DNA-binding CsgD family transcriptional regulator